MIYLSRPDGFVSEGDVSGTFICVGDRMLLLHRAPGTVCSGTWGLVAGKAESGESPLRTARREIAEETGLAVPPERIIPFVSVYVVRDPSFGPVGRQFLYHLFIVRLEREPRIDLAPREHDHCGWFTVVQALTVPLVDSGRECIELFRDANRDA